MATITPDTGARYFSKIFGDNHAAPAFQYIWDASVVWRNGIGQLQTGAARPVVPGDLAANVSVSGLSLSVGAVNLTGVNVVTLTGNTPVTITNPVLAISGALSVAAAPIQAVSGYVTAAVTGGTSGAALGSLDLSRTYLPVSGVGVFNVGNLAITGGSIQTITTGSISVSVDNTSVILAIASGNARDLVNNVLLSGVSGLLASNLTDAAWVTGSGNYLGSLDLSHTYLGTSGVGTFATNDTAGNLYLASISGSLITLLSDNVAITGAVSGNALGSLDVTRTYLGVSGIGGSMIGIDTGVRAVNITNTGPIAISGVVLTIVTGGSVSASVPNPLGITGVSVDQALPSIAGFATNFLAIGGRMVNPSGAGSITGYNNTGNLAILNIAPNGGVYVNQGVLDPTQDAVMTVPSGSVTTPVNSISGVANGGWGTPLPNNPARLGWGMQNLTTGVIFGRMGVGVTSGNAHFVLKPGSTTMDGLGASWTDMPAIWKGPVSTTGYFVTNPFYTAWEIS